MGYGFRLIGSNYSFNIDDLFIYLIRRRLFSNSNKNKFSLFEYKSGVII